jgi:hypothetical protein
MALNPSGAISLAGPSAGQSIAVELGLSATAAISLNDTVVRTLAQVPSGVIVMPTDFYGKSSSTATQKAIFGFGLTAAPLPTNITNLVSNTGVVASDTPGVGTASRGRAAAGYGGDKAIFGFGQEAFTPFALYNYTNLVSNTGVVSSDTPGAPGVTARGYLAAAGYGGDKAIFGFGESPRTNITNLVSNTGVVAANSPGVGLARNDISAAGYGGDKAIFGFGQRAAGPVRVSSITNLVSNTGVVASDTPGVGTESRRRASAGYGGDKAIFAFGAVPSSPQIRNFTNLVSNTGVVASDTPGAPGVTANSYLAAAGYGGDKAIFGFGGPINNPTPFTYTNITNLVSNTGVVAADTPGVGTARTQLAAAGYSST